MSKLELLFGDIVVVEEDMIGVVVKSWQSSVRETVPPHYEVYVRMYNEIREYPGHEVKRYRVHHKYLDEEELGYQND